MLKSAAVNIGEEIPSQPGDENYQRTKRAREEYDQEHTSVVETNFEQAAIAVTEIFKGLLKTPLKSYERIATGGAFLLRLIASQ